MSTPRVDHVYSTRHNALRICEKRVKNAKTKVSGTFAYWMVNAVNATFLFFWMIFVFFCFVFARTDKKTFYYKDESSIFFKIKFHLLNINHSHNLYLLFVKVRLTWIIIIMIMASCLRSRITRSALKVNFWVLNLNYSGEKKQFLSKFTHQY